MNTQPRIGYSMSGTIANTVSVYDCTDGGDPNLVAVNFGAVRIYTHDTEALLEMLRTAALELAQLMAKKRDAARTGNE
jgi:hypothetical protein